MKVLVKDSKLIEVNLTDKEYIAEGGEGTIYGKGNTIYKIFLDPKNSTPVSKINELSVLTPSNILKPKLILLDPKSHNPIGFTMDWIQKTVPLCKLFSKDFKNRFNITNPTIIKLVEKIEKDINFIHSQDIIMVDGNENNFLVDEKTFLQPYFIDVNSWQTKSFPATVQMLSIKDYHSKKIDKMTDWFAFAIVSCQLFLGIHPFKGNHPNFKRSDLEGRMRANASIFNSIVTLPSSVSSFSNIPDQYKKWYIDMFEKGIRILPPSCSGVVLVAAPIVKKIVGSDKFIVDLLNKYPFEIIRYSNGYVILSDYNVTKDSQNYFQIYDKAIPEIFYSTNGTPLMATINNYQLRLTTFDRKPVPIPDIRCTNMMVSDNMLFVQMGDKITEFSVNDMSNQLVGCVESVWNILPNATTLFNGVIYQDILGQPYFMIPFKSQNNKTSCSQINIKELKGYRIMEAVYDSKILNVIAKNKKNQYDSFIFRFNENLSSYEIFMKEEDVQYHVPNFNVLDSGIVVRITVDDEVMIFRNKFGTSDVKNIKDDSINFDFKLCRNRFQVLGRKDDSLYSIKMK